MPQIFVKCVLASIVMHINMKDVMFMSVFFSGASLSNKSQFSVNVHTPDLKHYLRVCEEN